MWGERRARRAATGCTRRRASASSSRACEPASSCGLSCCCCCCCCCCDRRTPPAAAFAVIVALLPLLCSYVELALLECYRFIFDADFAAILLRLVHSVGIATTAIPICPSARAPLISAPHCRSVASATRSQQSTHAGTSHAWRPRWAHAACSGESSKTSSLARRRYLHFGVPSPTPAPGFLLTHHSINSSHRPSRRQTAARARRRPAARVRALGHQRLPLSVLRDCFRRKGGVCLWVCLLGGP